MTEKRKRDDDAAAAAAAASDAEAARNVALHYSGRDNQSTAQRKQSPISEPTEVATTPDGVKLNS